MTIEVTMSERALESMVLAACEREGWPPEDRRACIERQIRNRRRIATSE